MKSVNSGGDSRPAPARVTGGAVSLVGAVEQRETAQLGRVETQLAGEEEVVLGIEGPEVGIEFLVLRQRKRHGEHGALLVVEDVLSEYLAELVGVGRSASRATRSAGVALAISCAANSGRSACTRRSLARPSRLKPPDGVPLGVEAERRREAEVLQRRHRAKAGYVQIRAAELHGKVVALRVRVLRIVAGRAGHGAGRRETWVGEDLFAQRDGIRSARIGCARNTDARAAAPPRAGRARGAPAQTHVVRRARRGLNCRFMPVRCPCPYIDRRRGKAPALHNQGWLPADAWRRRGRLAGGSAATW